MERLVPHVVADSEDRSLLVGNLLEPMAQELDLWIELSFCLPPLLWAVGWGWKLDARDLDVNPWHD
jgi:hypothetical protein